MIHVHGRFHVWVRVTEIVWVRLGVGVGVGVKETEIVWITVAIELSLGLWFQRGRIELQMSSVPGCSLAWCSTWARWCLALSGVRVAVIVGVRLGPAPG